jgi:hypothetical protein
LKTEPADTTDVVQMIKERHRQSESVLSPWKKEARENYDMVAGDGRQWDQEAKAKLDGEDRPCVEFNRLGTIIDAVSGSEVNNRQEVTFIPRQLGDVQKTGVASLRTAAAKWVRDNCDAADEESDAFMDVLITGVGCTQTRMDYEEEEEGKAVIERVDPLELEWDASAKKKNIADARWISRKCQYTYEEIESKWPDKCEELQGNTKWDDSEDQEPNSADAETFYKDSGTPGTTKGSYEVIQHQWYELETVYKVLDPTSQQLVEMDEERFTLLQSIQPTIQSAKISRRIYMQAFICGDTELETGPGPCKCGFTLQVITGKRDRNKRYWYGLVRPGKDPQRWANKFFSQLLHIINSNSKGGLLYETGAVSNPRKLEQNWARADSAIQLNAGGLAKIMPKPVVNVPPAIADMMEFSISSIRDATGVNLELLGMVDRQQAGVLEAQRTRAGLTILAPFFDALRLYRKKQGRILAYFINEYISDGRLIRVAGPGGEQFIPLMRQPDDVDYDVIVDSAPTARDTKEQAWMALQQIIPMFMQAGIQLPPEALDYMPLPESLVASMKKAYVDHLQKASAVNPMQEAEVNNKRADTEFKEASAAEKYFKAGETGINMLAALMGPQPIPQAPGQMPMQPQQMPPPPGIQ